MALGAATGMAVDAGGHVAVRRGVAPAGKAVIGATFAPNVIPHATSAKLC